MAKLSFRESAQAASMIMEEVNSGAFAMIYLLMGTESYYIDRVCNHIIDKALTDEERDFNQTIVYGKDVSGADVASSCLRFPMMAPRQVVVVKEAQLMSKSEELMPYVNNPNQETVLVLCYKDKPMDKRSVLYKSLAKKATVLETATPKENEVDVFIKSVVKSHGAEIDPSAMMMVAHNIGGDLNRIVSEFEKLFARLPEGTTLVTPTHIEDNIGISKQNNIFELTKALSNANFELALRITDNLSRNIKDNPLPACISLLFTHFQRIVTLGIMIWQNKKSGLPPPPSTEIAQKLGVMTFFVSEYVNAIRVFPTPKAFKAIELLRTYDMKSKGIGASFASDGTILKELVLKLITL